MSGREPGEVLLAPWAGPHGGVPPFDRVEVSDFEPAFEAAMRAMREEIERIERDASEPTFENTIEALEDAGRTLDQVETVYGVFSGTMSSAAFQEVERTLAPKLAAFADEIAQDAALFARVERVYATREALPPARRRLVERRHRAFVRAGARLDAGAKARVADINGRLATLYTQFAQNVLADEDTAVFVDDAATLEGLPADLVTAFAREAHRRGRAGAWAIPNTRSAAEPVLTYASREELRRAVFTAFVGRGESAAHDNRPVITEIVALRAERTRLLGHETFAHFRLEDTMAKTPASALALMERVWSRAVTRVGEEVRDMQALAAAHGVTGAIAPWDYRYWAEKVRKATYDLDEDEVKPYLELERLREGMFWVAGELFGFAFAPAESVPVYHPDVRVFRVTAAATGREIGLFYFDPFARPGKQSGAWMNAYRAQERFRADVTPLVSNNLNFVRGEEDAPVLVGWQDAVTLFHEFGHALHALCSEVDHPSQSGTRVARDYVELPSQLFEHWLPTRELLARFALHHRTKQPMPEALVARIERAATFNQGFATVEYLSGAILDMQLHLATGESVDPAAFERDALAALGMPAEIVMRHRLPHFAHVFSGESYAAGYYSYLWADALVADAFEAFRAAPGGAYDREVAARLRAHVLSVGDTRDPAEAYRAFRGRDVDPDALLRKRGLA